MAIERLAQKPFGSHEIAPLAEPELDRVTIAVSGAGEIHPPPAHLGVSLNNMPFTGDRSFATVEPLQQLR